MGGKWFPSWTGTSALMCCYNLRCGENENTPFCSFTFSEESARGVCWHKPHWHYDRSVLSSRSLSTIKTKPKQKQISRVWSYSHLAFSSPLAVERHSDTSLPSDASEDGFKTAKHILRLLENKRAAMSESLCVYKWEVYRGDTWSRRQFILKST